MKRLYIIFMLALLIVGCSKAKEAASNGEILPGIGPDDDDGEVFAPAPPPDAGIPVEGENDPPPPPPGPQAPGGPQPVGEVKFVNSPANLRSCIIDEVCEKRIKAGGGSGTYIWEVTQGALPRGLEWVAEDDAKKKIKIQKIADQEIDDIGPFKFTFKVTDAADGDNFAEREFSLSISENIAMELHKLKAGEGEIWTAVEDTDDDGNPIPIIVEPYANLLVRVRGHSEKYTWFLDETKIECDEGQPCEGTVNGVTLKKDLNLQPPARPPEDHVSDMILTAEPGFVGKSVKISAEDEFGNKTDPKTISSIEFQKDPCTEPLELKGPDQIRIKRGEKKTIEFTIVGGKMPYVVKQQQTIVGETPTPLENGRPIDKSTFSIDINVPEESKSGALVTVNVTVEDSCDPMQSQEKTITSIIGCKIGMLEKGEKVNFNLRYYGGSDSDTDVCDDTEIRIQLRKSDGTDVALTGWDNIDENNNSVIDDMSPSYDMEIKEKTCLEDITQFRWKLDNGGCWEYADIALDKAVVVATIDRYEYFAGWGGTTNGGDHWWTGLIGGMDLEDDEAFKITFNQTCATATDLWCDKAPWDYKNWRN